MDATTPQPLPVQPVQNALNLICIIKSPEAQQHLETLLTQHALDNAKILNAVGTVHFARFVFLENNTKLALFTEYDGSLDTYVMDFVKAASPLFNMLLQHVADPPPLPVESKPQEFLDWVKKHDLPSVVPLYSAYPTLTVQDIVSNLMPNAGATASESVSQSG